MKVLVLLVAFFFSFKMVWADELPSGWYRVADTLATVSTRTGVAIEHLATFAAIESTFQSHVKNSQSSATGLFQFTAPTWRTMLKRYGSLYGLSPNASRKDPLANALMGAEYIKENQRILEARLRRPARLEEIYMAHLLSPRRAVEVIRTPSHHSVARLYPQLAAKNQRLFYHRPGHAKTAAQFVNGLKRKVEGAFIAYAGHAKVVEGEYLAKQTQRQEAVRKAEASMGSHCTGELTATQKLVQQQLARYYTTQQWGPCNDRYPIRRLGQNPFIIDRRPTA